MNMIRTPWGDHFYPEVIAHQTPKYRREHPDYQAAKSGDPDAAAILASDMINHEQVAWIRNHVDGRDVTLLPVMARESSGYNIIPVLFAENLGNLLKLPVDDKVYQANSPQRTGKDSEYRIKHQPIFIGEVSKKSYIIIDDHASMGATIANLKGYIESNGGEVLLATTISAKPGKIVPTERHYAKLMTLSGNNP